MRGSADPSSCVAVPGAIRPPGTLPRLLPTGAGAGPASLAGHLARYGPPPAGLGQRQRESLISEVARAGLTGRGGAGYPTARKLAAVAAGHAPVVVANGTEGEPASAKDKVLMTRSPQLVLDGAVLAAEMVGARETVIVAHPAARRVMDDAAAERARVRFNRVRIRVRTAADRFVAGEASAVVHWIERGVPAPMASPPRVGERGLRGAPTLVQNVETLAHLALIARYGAAWFRSVGTPAEPGSMLVTVLGAVHEPVCAEIAVGTPIGQALDLAGGRSAPLQALLLGGYFGDWVSAAVAIDRPFSSAGLADLGAGPGRRDRGTARRCLRAQGNRPGGSLPGRRIRRPMRPLPVRPGCDRRPGRAARSRPRRRCPPAAPVARSGRRPRRVRSSHRRRPPDPQLPAGLRRRAEAACDGLVLRDSQRPAGSAGPEPMTAGTGPAAVRLRVDLIACDGRGLCAEALPELISLDDWGFPIVDDQAVPPRLLADVRETARACPKLALWLERG